MSHPVIKNVKLNKQKPVHIVPVYGCITTQ